MASLIAKTPLDGTGPVQIGAFGLAEVSPGPITSIAPFRDAAKRLAAALQAAHGLGFPEPNRISTNGAARLVWTGRDQAFLLGVAPAASLAAHAALTDQSDAWAMLRLGGTGAEAVLARLVPLDLRRGVFAIGHTGRSLLQHVPAVVLRTGPEVFEIMVMRSFGTTARHELQTAMQGVAARHAVQG